MLGETGFMIYNWFIYAWLVVGALLIGIPAVKEIFGIFKHK